MITGLNAGGAETMLVQLVRGLSEKGFEQQVVSLTGEGVHSSALRDMGVPVSGIGGGALSVLAGVARCMSVFRPDVAMGWMYHGNIAVTLANTLVPGKRRTIWNIRASNMDQERYKRILKWSARLSRRPDMIVANSQAGLDFHLEQGFSPRDMGVVPNGFDTERFRPDIEKRKALRQELGLSEEDIVVMTAARVDPMKDYGSVLAALGSVPEVRGVLIGLDTEKLSLPANVMALGLRRDIPALLTAGDIIVSGSAFGEGFSNALAEGMSCGLIPVATDVGDSARIVADTGVIVPPCNSAALAEAISSLAAQQRTVIGSKGERARARIVENFTIEKAVERFALICNTKNSMP